ncbi:hypothetical protein EBZ37_01110 [bacterium]|nr:hypothetical protein [bacterium]
MALRVILAVPGRFVFLALLFGLGAFSFGRASGSTEPLEPCAAPKLRLAIRLVSYADSAGSVFDRNSAQSLVNSLNRIWAQCKIGFELEQYEALEPYGAGLRSSPRFMAELPRIRDAFRSEDRLLVVMTGQWSADGDITSWGADAWTTLPGNPPYGAIIDRPVCQNANIVAHELGHYLGLLHVQDDSNLLSPVVSRSSQTLSAEQCARARAVAQSSWRAMLRT